jgi:hypothetical protein
VVFGWRRQTGRAAPHRARACPPIHNPSEKVSTINGLIDVMGSCT